MKHVENIMTKSRTIFAVGAIAGALMWSPCIVAQVNPYEYGVQVEKDLSGEQPAVYVLINDENGDLRLPYLDVQTTDVYAVDDYLAKGVYGAESNWILVAVGGTFRRLTCPAGHISGVDAKACNAAWGFD
mgnify:CR=1 FL=1